MFWYALRFQYWIFDVIVFLEYPTLYLFHDFTYQPYNTQHAWMSEEAPPSSLPMTSHVWALSDFTTRLPGTVYSPTLLQFRAMLLITSFWMKCIGAMNFLVFVFVFNINWSTLRAYQNVLQFVNIISGLDFSLNRPSGRIQSVCPSVCMSVCMSVCPLLWGIV